MTRPRAAGGGDMGLGATADSRQGCDDYGYVDRARLCLRTAATNGPIFYPLDDM
jgi:hypothetical protein